MKACVHGTVLALGLDGSVIVNMREYDDAAGPRVLVERALKLGSPLFIGVVLSPREAAKVRRWLEGGGREGGAHVLGARDARRRSRPRPR